MPLSLPVIFSPEIKLLLKCPIVSSMTLFSFRSAERLLRMDQMQILTFLQDEIVRDFGFDDDDVIDSLKDCLEELRRTNLDTPPPLSECYLCIFIPIVLRSNFVPYSMICNCLQNLVLDFLPTNRFSMFLTHLVRRRVIAYWNPYSVVLTQMCVRTLFQRLTCCRLKKSASHP